MNIFLTWSGETSLAIATALHDWIPHVLQRVRPFLSSEDIRKGARWQQEIARQLEAVKYAIVCLTAENVAAPWIHFEAGAVSKQIEAAKVTALLFGIDAKDVVGPLTQFQNTQVSKTDLKKLVIDLNAELGEDQVPQARLDSTFELFWPQLDEKLVLARRHIGRAATQPARRPDEVLSEILEMSRSTSRSLSKLVTLEERLVSAHLSNLPQVPGAPPNYFPRIQLGSGFPNIIGNTLVHGELFPTVTNAGGSRIVGPAVGTLETPLPLRTAVAEPAATAKSKDPEGSSPSKTRR